MFVRAVAAPVLLSISVQPSKRKAMLQWPGPMVREDTRSMSNHDGRATRVLELLDRIKKGEQ